VFGADDRFVSLTEWLSPKPANAESPTHHESSDIEHNAAPTERTAGSDESYDAIRSARLFQAHLCDTLDALVVRLARDLAADVLARELSVGCVDIAALARRLVAERTHDGPLRIRVAPADAGFRCPLPVLVDANLQRGDAILECTNGEVDARLGVRLADVLSAVCS